MNYKQLKSVASSKTGEALRTISVITLIIGIIASIILFVQCFQSVDLGYHHVSAFDWVTFASCLQVLIGSIFVCIVGRAIAKSADYIEAIYKHVNKDFELDRFFENGCAFIPGDVVMCKNGDKKEQVTITDITTDANGYNHYHCKNANGEEFERYHSALEAIENK